MLKKTSSGVILTLLLVSILSLTFDTQARALYPLAERSAQIINVPFHYQIKDYYCGPACLEMVLDYYGQDVSQLEIAEVARTHPYTTYTDELRRAAHFSNISTSKGIEMPENITGYTLRRLGYATFEQWSMTIDQLKTLLDRDSPIILLMWYSPKHVSGHYRVAIGYNDTHVMLHDPWNNVDWGGLYGGPYLAFNYSTFLDLWQYSGHWGLFTCPWSIELNIPPNIWQGQNFTLAAKIIYPCPAPFPNSSYPSSSCNATITLPNGLTLVAGETNKKTLGSILPEDSANISWTIQAENIGFYNITVEAEGKVAGSVGAHENFPTYNYEDRIGTSTNRTLEVRVIGDINNDFRVDIKDLVLVIKHYASYPGHPMWNPNADVNSDGKVDIKDLVLVIKHFGEHYP